MTNHLKLFLIALLFVSNLIVADDEVDLDALLEDGFSDDSAGFDTESAFVEDGSHLQVAAEEKSDWRITGDLSLSADVELHHAPTLSKLRNRFALEVERRLSKGSKLHIDGTLRYDAAHSAKVDVEIGELWWEKSISPEVDLKLGRQIVVWGKSESLRVVDVINPLDMREPGMVDIEDLRLATTMLKAGYYPESLSQWNFTLLAIPELRANKTANYGSDYYLAAAPPLPSALPNDSLGNSEFAVAAHGVFSGWDLSLHAARVYDNASYNKFGKQEHARFSMVGISADVVLDSWLLSTELAQLQDVRYTPLPNSDQKRIDGLLGVSYSGFKNTTISLERSLARIDNYDVVLATGNVEKESWQTALRYTGEFMHSQLKLTMLMNRAGKNLDKGGFSRFSAEYELADGLNLTGGLILYHSAEKPPYSKYADNDKLFTKLNYSF